MAIAVAQKYPEASIWVNDIYEPVYLFWKTIRDEKKVESVVEICRTMRESILAKAGVSEEEIGKRGATTHGKESYLKGRVSPHTKPQGLRSFSIMSNNEIDEVVRVAHFLYLVKCSYGGQATSGKNHSPAKFLRDFRETLFQRLPLYAKLTQNWEVTNLDYRDVIGSPGESFVFLDPPYLDVSSPNLYGSGGELHSGFSHKDFYSSVNDSDKKILITYDKNPVHTEALVDNGNFKEVDITFNYSMGKVGHPSPKVEAVFMNY